jgi:prepilin-type N-terminal cleavage/methylation domain-containing protein
MSMSITVQRRAFSMIELLVVIAIIGILAAMILTGAKALGIGSKKARTQTILAAVRKGLELTIANKGGSISPVEHPLAGSRGDIGGGRFAFKRSTTNGGGSVATSGDALAGVSLADLGGSSNVLLLPDDIYNDKRSYLLYGMPRERLGILGAMQKRCTKYLLLPRPQPVPPPAPHATVPMTNGAFTATNYPQYAIPSAAQDADNGAPGPTGPGMGFGKPGANKQALDYVFGSSNVQSELSSLKALYMADPNTAHNLDPVHINDADNAFKYAVNPAAVPGDSESLALVYTDDKTEDAWKPGCVAMTGSGPSYTITTYTSGGSTKWKHYRLPGLALYDAWGIEVLYSISSLGGVRLQSPGADGVFKIDPGENHIIDTTDPVGTLDPKDKDGSRDNISQEVEEQ